MLNFLAAIGSAPSGGGGSFESIATVTASGSASSITFSSIPQTYQHLQIRYTANTGRADTGNDAVLMRINGDSSTNYTRHMLQGDGSTATATGNTSQTYITLLGSCASPSTSTLAAAIIDIHDYTNTAKNTTVRVFQGVDFNTGNTQSVVQLVSGLWLNTAAITSITLDTNTGSNFTSSSTFALYGIKGA